MVGLTGLVLAAVVGSFAVDAVTNLYVWVQGTDLGEGRRLRRHLPSGLTLSGVLIGAMLRALIGVLGVVVLASFGGWVTSVTGAMVVGALLPALLAVFVGVHQASSVPAPPEAV